MGLKVGFFDRWFLGISDIVNAEDIIDPREEEEKVKVKVKEEEE